MTMLLEKYSPILTMLLLTMLLDTDTLCIKTFFDETIIAVHISPVMVPLLLNMYGRVCH